MKDPYEILGVQKTDSEAAIRAAYRKLAKRHHPDVNPGKPEAAERFKEISVAYDILSDKDKRARYDRGEIDAAGNEMPPQRPFYRDFADAAGREKYRADAGFDAEDLESIFAQAFGGRAGPGAGPGANMGGGRRFSMRGQDARYQLTLDFLDAVNGTTRRVDTAGRAHARCAHPRRRARRPGDPAQGPGHARHRRRRGRRCAGRGQRRTTPGVPPRG